MPAEQQAQEDSFSLDCFDVLELDLLDISFEDMLTVSDVQGILAEVGAEDAKAEVAAAKPMIKNEPGSVKPAVKVDKTSANQMKKKSKRKPKTDPNKPKNYTSAYNFFAKSVRAEISTQVKEKEKFEGNAKEINDRINKITGTRWKAMDGTFVFT